MMPAFVDDDILELTQFAPEEPRYEEIEPEPEPFQRPFFGDLGHDERLVSDTTAAASSAAFASVADRLARSRRISDNLPIGNAGLTLEDLTKDLLRPLLRDWLDDNLPELVERIVREEVERLARDSM